MNAPTEFSQAMQAAQQAEIGRRLLAIGEGAKAAERFRAALSFTPDNAFFHAELSRALHQQRKFSEALAEINIALQLSPHWAHFHYLQGVFLHAQNRLEPARQSLERAIEINPNGATYHQRLGLVLWHIANDSVLGKVAQFDSRFSSIYDQAADSVRRALELEPEQVEAHRTLGHILNACGKSEEALACYEHALQLKPEDVQTHILLGLQLQLSDAARSVEHFQEALRLDPNDRTARRQLTVSRRHLIVARPYAHFQNARLQLWNATFGRLIPVVRIVVAFCLMLGSFYLQDLVKPHLAKESVQPFYNVSGSFIVACIVVFASYGDWFTRPRHDPKQDKTST